MQDEAGSADARAAAATADTIGDAVGARRWPLAVFLAAWVAWIGFLIWLWLSMGDVAGA